MTADEFFSKYLNKGIDFDGYYGNQCMDLYQQYNKEVVGAFHLAVPAAADVFNNFPLNFYTKIANTPDGVPQKGDVVIWKKGTSLPYGHIAVFSEGDAKSFISFDQNWPVGSLCHFQKHDYNLVTGWLRPKKFEPKPEVPENPVTFTDQTKIPLLGKPWGEMEIQAIRSTLNDQVTTIQKKDDRIQELDGLVESLQKITFDQVKQIESLQISLDECREYSQRAENASKTVDEATVGELVKELLRRLKLV